MRILILGIDGVGNTIMSLPMIAAIRARYPEAFIAAVASSAGNSELFLGCGQVDAVHQIPRGETARLWHLWHLRREGFDYAFLPFPSTNWRSPVYSRVAGAKNIVRHRYPPRRKRSLTRLVTHLVKADPALHDVVQNLNLLRVVAIGPETAKSPSFPVLEDDLRAAKDLLMRHGVDPHRGMIVIHPGVAHTHLGPSKCWPGASYGDLYRRLVDLLEDQIVFMEGPGELGAASSIVRTHEGARATVIAVGSIPLAAAILKCSRAYVGSDSAFAHLSSAVGTPTVTIFGPANPTRVAPFGYRDLVAAPPTSCFPCYRYPWRQPAQRCAPPFCIDKISVDTVVTLLQTALQRQINALS